MTDVEKAFLEIISASIRKNDTGTRRIPGAEVVNCHGSDSEQSPCTKESNINKKISGYRERYLASSDWKRISDQQWEDLFRLASIHSLLPMVYDTCSNLDLFSGWPSDQKKIWQEKALSASIRQIIQEKEFLTLMLHAQQQGLEPIVLKGIICRMLYPQPCLRPSVDEDLFISDLHGGQVMSEDYHRFFLSEGLYEDNHLTAEERAEAVELSYHKPASPTYIELHKALFDPGAEAYGDWNILLSAPERHIMDVKIEDVILHTLDPDYHLLYLILHSCKHFIHSGIGIRPVCDISLFADKYKKEIHFDWIEEKLQQINAFDFCRALLQIAKQYLLPDASLYLYIKNWRIDEVETAPLLADILAAGIHGNESLTRLHSSNITLQAVKAEKKEKETGKAKTDKSPKGTKNQTIYGHIWKILFPPISKLKSRYSYLKKYPFLLPLAWLQRIMKYLKENRNTQTEGKEKNKGVTKSIRIGEERIRLLKEYHLI